jgi:phage pi2 protein 07
MAGELSLGSATTTNLKGVVPDFIVSSKALDVASEGKDGVYHHYFDKATQNFGYYSQIPEIFSAANALATWAVGRGWSTQDKLLEQELLHVSGMGQDTIDQIFWNQEVVKLIVGDAFTEVKREDNIIINMIPISPERIRIAYKNGRIMYYETWNSEKWVKINKEDMWHSSNKRIGDQIHGTSQIDACKWIIDARNEALVDGRLIQNRGKALGIAYYKTDNAGKIAFANRQIELAVKNGEMVGLPEGTVEIREFPTKNIVDRQSWIQYLENFFYQTFGVPRSIVSSDGTSEVGGKMGHVIFETIYAKEQIDLENELWGQQGIEIKFNRPPSLGGMVAQDMNKSTGDTSIQPNDVMATMQRE